MQVRNFSCLKNIHLRKTDVFQPFHVEALLTGQVDQILICQDLLERTSVCKAQYKFILQHVFLLSSPKLTRAYVVWWRKKIFVDLCYANLIVLAHLYKSTGNYRNNSKYWDTQTSYRSCP